MQRKGVTKKIAKQVKEFSEQLSKKNNSLRQSTLSFEVKGKKSSSTPKNKEIQSKKNQMEIEKPEPQEEEEKKEVTAQDLKKKPWLQFPVPKKTVDLSHLKSTDLLPVEFYRQDVVTLAKELLGKIIVRTTDKGTMKVRIVETEAYKAPLDRGCHAFNNKKTNKTSSFWLDGGFCYMYSIYGANYCLNVVAARKDEPEAVLIRACEPVSGEHIMWDYRGNLKSKRPKDFTGGPAKYTKAMDIDVKRFNGIDLKNKKKNLYLEKGDDIKFEMVSGPRINIDYAQEWTNAPWRFYIKNNQYVSV